MLLLAPSLVYGEAGEGLKSGNYNLSLGVSGTGSFDSNVFYESSKETDSLSVAPSVLVEPFITLTTVEKGAVELDMDARVRWQQYLSETTSSQSGLAADLYGGVSFNRGGAVSFAVDDKLIRTNEPPANPADFAYNRFSNTLGATLGFHPGGKVFQHYLSYDFTLFRHDAELETLDRSMHDVTLVNYMRFLPRTAFVLTGQYSLNLYDNPARSAGLNNVDNSQLRVTGGLTGLITRRISIRVIGGWGWSFHDAGESFSGLLLDTELAYAFGLKSANSRIYIGYEQGFSDSSISNYYDYLRPYAGVEVGLGRRIRAGIEFDTSFRSYVGTPQNVGGIVNPETLSDALVAGDIFGSFFIAKWWSVDLRYTLSANFTDDTIINNNFGSEAVRDYVRHAVYFGTTVRY